MKNHTSRYKAPIAAARIAAIGLIFFWSLDALAADVKIIANLSVKANSISTGELRGVFLADRTSLKDGSHVEPVFERSGPAHEIFLREFLRESNESLQSHYGALVFTGKAAMPKSFNSDDEVLAYVARTRGAIGYVRDSAGTEGVKVLAVVAQGSRSERTLLTAVEPEYPETLRQLHIGGLVRLQVTISPQGRVETVTLLGGNPILGDSAVRAVRQWVYAAAPSRTTLEVIVPFDAH
jgi:TonB family protein